MGAQKPKQTTWFNLNPVTEAEMRREIEDGLFFAPWTGNVDTALQTNTDGTVTREIVNASNSIVEKVEGLGMGRDADTLQIPLLMELTGRPLTGNAYLVGTGESLKHQWRKVFVNQINKTVDLYTGLMEELRTGKLINIPKYSRPALIRWFRKWLNAEFVSALYDGHNMSVTLGRNVSMQGIGANKVFHPHIYTNHIVTTDGTGTFAAIGDKGKNKTQSQIEASQLVTGTALTYPSDYMLDTVGEELDELKIQKAATYNNIKYWLCVLDRRTFNKLKRNSDLPKAWQQAFMGKEYNNPYFGQETWIYGEFIFAINNQVPRAWDNTRKDFEGRSDMGYADRMNQTSGVDHRFMVFLGNNALGWSRPLPFQMETESSNFNQIKELAMMIICGIGRAEYVAEEYEGKYFKKGNEDTTILDESIDVYNTSSLLVAVKR